MKGKYMLRVNGKTRFTQKKSNLLVGFNGLRLFGSIP